MTGMGIDSNPPHVCHANRGWDWNWMSSLGINRPCSLRLHLAGTVAM